MTLKLDHQIFKNSTGLPFTQATAVPGEEPVYQGAGVRLTF